MVFTSLTMAVQAQQSDAISEQLLKKQEAELNAYLATSPAANDTALQQTLVKSFIVMHPDYYISLLKFRDLVAHGKLTNVEKRFNNFTNELRLSALGKEVSALIQAQKVVPGQLAPDFQSLTASGTPVKLSDWRGKYIFLDFWASWCKPCRAETPFILKAWNRFRDKNFDVWSVSLDGNKENWLQAIQDDGTGGWQHASDLKAWQSEVVKAYMITAIPRSFLIDPNGKIIAIDLREQMLEEQLEKIFLQ